MFRIRNVVFALVVHSSRIVLDYGMSIDVQLSKNVLNRIILQRIAYTTLTIITPADSL